MSLIGQLPLAAIQISCRDIEGSRRFYRDLVGLRSIDLEGEEVLENSTSRRGGQKSKLVVQKGGGESDHEAHFDLGNIRLTLVASATSPPAPAKKPLEQPKRAATPLPVPSAQQQQHHRLVFVVENGIEVVVGELAKRGVKFSSKKPIVEDASGRAAWFPDPDGNVIYLWQPPSRESSSFKDQEAVVRHYELVSRALADLKDYDREAATEAVEEISE